MKITILLVATILIWIALIAAIYQRIFQMPRWFANPPASFELIRKERKNLGTFWIILSVLFFIFAILALILNWEHHDARSHIIGSLACVTIIQFVNGVYLIKEVNAFSKITPDSTLTPELTKRIRMWLRWSIVRIVLLIIATGFISIAYNHV